MGIAGAEQTATASLRTPASMESRTPEQKKELRMPELSTASPMPAWMKESQKPGLTMGSRRPGLKMGFRRPALKTGFQTSLLPLFLRFEGFKAAPLLEVSSSSGKREGKGLSKSLPCLTILFCI